MEVPGALAIAGSKFKTSNSRDRNYTAGKIDRRQQQIEESIQRYLDLIETADRTSPTGFDVKTVRLYEKIARLRQQMREFAQVSKQLKKQPDKELSMTDPDAGHGNKRKRLRHSGLQRSGRRGHEASPDC